jgi:hypothetical protein
MTRCVGAWLDSLPVRHSTLMRPSGTDSAPYLAAFERLLETNASALAFTGVALGATSPAGELAQAKFATLTGWNAARCWSLGQPRTGSGLWQ